MKRVLILFAVMLPTLLLGVSSAVTLSPNDVAAHMADPASVSKILRATKLFDENDIDALKTYLDSLPELQKEEALTVLARRALDFSTMTPEREKFLVTISRQQPKYLVKSQGDGFWVTMPAFNYAGEAKWVLNRWQIKLMQDEAIRLLNYNQLNLSKWLSFSSNDYALRREAIVTLVPTLNKTMLDKLVALYLDDKNMVWSPDNGLLAALAENTDDVKLYDLLWLRRTDSYSLAALQKLEIPPITAKHIQLMIAATANPVLAETAIRQLAGLNPLPQNVKDFLQKQIADRQRGKDIAAIIAQKGHKEWLRELEAQSSGVIRRNIRNGLEQVEG
ncbi:hypothetical protein [Grimontia sp. NTOU-MAR1]|uniref:hypothetical protein n=1 Tax=Grimontia sp. NTOU-MAR1 TaxID=3111011 RepID=UPI002DB9E49B|nr:hypothetical protein [Grimontia sp. NTOU-MAR1]WRV96748.1 hypothetical protein VP504_11765 [Grimontia sp. NTOU-MAR1]